MTMKNHDLISYQIRKAEKEILTRKENGWYAISLDFYTAGVVNTLEDLLNNPYVDLTQVESTELEERIKNLLYCLN